LRLLGETIIVSFPIFTTANRKSYYYRLLSFLKIATILKKAITRIVQKEKIGWRKTMDINQSPSGRVVKAFGYTAFLPNPLPPTLEWDDHLVSALSRADQLLGKLAGEGSKLPDPHILIQPFVTREAVLSSTIEGTQATLEEMLADAAGAHVGLPAHDIQEVRNYMIALDYGLMRLKEFPLSLRLIKEIHEKLMQGVRGKHATPGEFRRSQNWIGTPGCTLSTAKYVPPPSDELMHCLGDFELFLHEKKLPHLIHIALCHYQFEAIHPFLDGNGRVGRLLITLLLIERKLLPSPLLYLSAFFESTRSTYYHQLYDVSAHGTWNEWLIYFLNGVATQSADALSRAEQINDLINKWLTLVAGSSSNTVSNLIKQCAANPFLTTRKVAEHFNIAFTTAQRAIQKLESLGIVTQRTSNRRDRVYCATAILAILDKPTHINLVTEKS